MNLIAKIKRLEAEAAERDKRIAALEARLTPASDFDERAAPPGFFEAILAAGGPTVAPDENRGLAAMVAPKKRKTRAKTYGTE